MGHGEWWIDRWESVGALREGNGGRADPPPQRDGTWHPFISSAGFIFGVAIATLSRRRQSPAEREKRVGCMWLLERIFR